MNAFEKQLKTKILKAVEYNLSAYTQSLCLQVFQKGEKLAELDLGRSYKYYDLASLTKPLFTVSTFMRYNDEKRLTPEDRIQKLLEWWPHKSTRIKEVLSHHAGLAWWYPFFEMLDKKDSTIKKREEVRLFFENLKLGSKKKSVYSDLDFILLGFVMEAAEEHSLLQIWGNTSRPWGLKSLHFNAENKPTYKRTDYAPTEKCPWRKKVLQGEVHDDNTWAMGGVSTHAGLFGSLEDVSAWGLLLREALKNKAGSALASHETAKLFCKRQVPRSVGDWALGFTLPSQKDSTAGHHFSPSSVGHTGFTGTSFWYDPKRDLLVTILANRVYPTRENVKFRTLRPLIHDFIVESL
ncbi:MAG: serine hydrolase domain-containing protein [Bdellovibrionota bacterium]